jgi:hypothetical protein
VGPKGRPVACVIVSGDAGRPRQEIRTFATLPDDRLQRADWRFGQGGTPGALAATGVSGKPVGNLRAGAALPLLRVTARPSKAVPGRKTAGRDGAWLADPLRPGRRRGSVVPARPPRELRARSR